MSEIKRYYPSDIQSNLGQPRAVFTEHQNGQLCMSEDVGSIAQRNKELEQRNAELKLEFVKFRKSSDIIISIMTDRNLELETLLSKAQQVLFTKIARIAEIDAEIARLREKVSIGAMVDAFLTWKLPTDFSPDAGISFDSEYGKKWGMPTGTNLLHAGQAQQMVEHILCGGEPKPAQIHAELIAWVSMQRNDIPATGEEFAKAIELWLDSRGNAGSNTNG